MNLLKIPFRLITQIILIIYLQQILKSKKSDCCVTLKRIEHEHPYRAKRLNKKTKIFKPVIKNINIEKYIKNYYKNHHSDENITFNEKTVKISFNSMKKLIREMGEKLQRPW